MTPLRPLLVASVVATLLGCSGGGDAGSTGGDQNVTEGGSRLSKKAQELWTIYVNNTIGSTRIQEGCKPRDVFPAPGVPYKGVAILVHGYSACPQQFDQLAKQLSSEGYEVLLPLMPGHGHVPAVAKTTISGHIQSSEPFKDDIVDMPSVKTRNRYRDFALTLNAIARQETTGARIIGGLSVGGAVATRAAAEDPSIYDRTLLITPFFQAAGFFLDNSLYVADHLAPNLRISWGADCLESRQQPDPRAGICQFTIDNLQATIQFGQETMAMASKIKKPVQLVGVEGDGAADDSAQQKVVKMLPNAKACYFRKPATHSLLSPYDNIHVDKFWLKAALAGTTEFVVSGKALPTAEASTEKGFLRCSTN